ncbi:glutathione S-transferase omega-like 2 [Xylogone sp. PMI_703]|nr:glutathione S-transferase omega-like 2 [Xylogone sp. PMI_703]
MAAKRENPSLSTVIGKDGSFVRPDAQFRSHISAEPGAKHPPEKGRYHLYVSYACPWAHRTLIVRRLKGLEDFISVTSVHHLLSLQTGWRFVKSGENEPGEFCTPDPLHSDVEETRDLYFKANPDYTGRFSVPILWDKKLETIVSNESSEIIRMLNSEFNALLPEKYAKIDIYPEKLRADIDAVNDWHYNNINNGVYKCGVAKTQEAYNAAVTSLFESLDKVEAQLTKSSSSGPYYFGATLTEADVRLYVTIIRFDPVYVSLFKCNIKDIRSGYPAIHKWLRHLYWDVPEFKADTIFEQIKSHYWESLPMNPEHVVPKGPLPHIFPKDKEVVVAQKL